MKYQIYHILVFFFSLSLHFMLLFIEGCVIVVSRINMIMIYKKMSLKLCCKTSRCFRNHKMIPLKYHLMKHDLETENKISISIHLFPIRCLSQDSKRIRKLIEI